MQVFQPSAKEQQTPGMYVLQHVHTEEGGTSSVPEVKIKGARVCGGV